MKNFFNLIWWIWAWGRGTRKPGGSNPTPAGQKKKTEPFLSTLQNTGVKFLQGVENFQQGEVLFVQAAYKFLHAAKLHFMQL